MSRKQPHGHYGWSPPSAGQPIWTSEVSLELTEDTAAATEKNLKPFRMPEARPIFVEVLLQLQQEQQILLSYYFC